jgi:hypothetical protein
VIAACTAEERWGRDATLFGRHSQAFPLGLLAAGGRHGDGCITEDADEQRRKVPCFGAEDLDGVDYAAGQEGEHKYCCSRGRRRVAV